MEPITSLAVAAHVCGGAGMLAVARSTYRRRSEPGMLSFTALAALFGWLGLSLAVLFLGHQLGIGEPALLLGFYTLTAVGLGASVPWIGFVLQYTGKSSVLSRRRVGLLTVPAVLNAVLGFGLTYRIQLGNMEFGDGELSTLDALLWNGSFLTMLCLLGLIVVGALLLLRTTHAYSHMSPVMGALLGFPVVLIGLGITFLPQVTMLTSPSVTGTAFGASLLVGVVCFGVVLREDDAFGSTSAAAGPVGRETILAEHSASVFTLDNEHRVVEFNEAARETFGLSSSEPLGEPVADVLDADVEDLTTDAPVGLTTADDLWTESTVFLETTCGRRRFNAEVSDLTDSQGRQLGLVVSLEDVTDRALREQRIGILNRVLRHNLRNKLSIVRGHAEMVPEAGEDVAEYADAIEAAATDLLALGERARDVERLLSVEEETSAPVSAVVEDLLETHRATREDTSFEEGPIEPVEVSTPREALAFVLDELCENAAKHNDAPDPRVTIGCEREGNWARISVRDNGPTLDDQELVAINAEDESPLEHGSGLGLWSVRWIVTAFGGQLTVEENQPRGSVVQLLLPIADEDVPAHPAGDRAAAEHGPATVGN